MFFIVGSGRSGSTLLRRLLIENTNCRIPNEIYALHFIIRRSTYDKDWGSFLRFSLAQIKHQQDSEMFLVDFAELEHFLLK